MSAVSLSEFKLGRRTFVKLAGAAGAAFALGARKPVLNALVGVEAAPAQGYEEKWVSSVCHNCPGAAD